ncbi:Endodeoxyribonuclease, RusA-like protein [Candidatus Magnetobacterium bavaricum]|uniref:Endodeoxyribonuclease, RusA-like protein n=1 Tax=Candidatus Magnetobacterium bavaricum TaxID=29290 RepID=A0A0F3GYC6_9BACT|nr:Endodeoxyribonuclease, RusA-like protein [Candidatus Magnetobacterium bavaricum]
MYSFIFTEHAPCSYNSLRGKKKAEYKKSFCNALAIDNKGFKKYNDDDELYGIVYYFYKQDNKLDVDNISKPIWDSLKGCLYNDDQQIKFRLVIKYDISKNTAYELDITNLSDDMMCKLLNVLENKNHILYVECGRKDISFAIFKFNLEKIDGY